MCAVDSRPWPVTVPAMSTVATSSSAPLGGAVTWTRGGAGGGGAGGSPSNSRSSMEKYVSFWRRSSTRTMLGVVSGSTTWNSVVNVVEGTGRGPSWATTWFAASNAVRMPSRVVPAALANSRTRALGLVNVMVSAIGSKISSPGLAVIKTRVPE